MVVAGSACKGDSSAGLGLGVSPRPFSMWSFDSRGQTPRLPMVCWETPVLEGVPCKDIF